MADNVAVTPGSGETLASDQVGGIQYPRCKVVWGADGTANDAAAAAPLPVTLYGGSSELIAKAEDAGHTSGDLGIQALSVRQNTAAALAGTDADYQPLITDANGRLHSTLSDVTFAEDAASSDGDKGIQVLTVRKNAAAATSGTDADYQPLVTNGLGQLHVQAGPNTVGGLSASHTVSTANTTETNVKNAAGMVYGIFVSNVNAAARYLKLYNKATAPIAGTDTPVLTLIVPGAAAGGILNVSWPLGVAFAAGIGFDLTTEATDAGTTGVAANELVVNILYK